jgi:hypothetical protein
VAWGGRSVTIRQTDFDSCQHTNQTDTSLIRVGQATIPVTLLVIVLGGLSTAVPATPGGLGTQQVLLVYALRETASAAVVLSFSLGMQAGVTIMNTLIGLAAAMLVFRTFRPLAAVRSSLALARPSGRAEQRDEA